jgi:hypothetical protein
MKPQKCAGPRNEAGTEKDRRSDRIRIIRPVPLPQNERFYPADRLVCLALAALLWDTGRARLRELEIGPEAFDDEPGRIAAVLLAGRDFTKEEIELLYRDDGEHLTWAETVEMFTLDREWARDIIDKFAKWFASRWMPAVLRWAADQMELGRSLEHVAPEIDRLLFWARPSILSVQGSAA